MYIDSKSRIPGKRGVIGKVYDKDYDYMIP
jgi:hypothetical protein